MDTQDPKGKIIDKISRNGVVKRVVAFSKKLMLPGFEGASFFEVMKFFISSLVKGTLPQRAAAMTYHIFIAIFPALLTLFSVISYLSESIKETILGFIESSVPQYSWPAISGVITEILTRRNGTLLSFSFIFALFFTLTGVNSIITNLNATYFEIEKRSFFKQLLVSLLITIIFGVLIILVAGIFVSTNFIFKKLDWELFGSTQFYYYAVTFSKWLLLFVMIYFFISFLYYLAPVNKKYFRFFSAGSIFATVAMVVLIFVLNFYFANFSRYNILYGSIGALLAVLLWLYLNSNIILLGFDLNVSIFIARQRQQSCGGDLVLDPLKEEDNAEICNIQDAPDGKDDGTG